MAKRERPYGVICVWEYREPKHRDSRAWFCVEVYGVDGDGYATSEHKTGSQHDDNPWAGWLNKKEPYDPPHDDDWEWVPIPGRAVTLWTTSGVELMGFNPPVEMSQLRWLDYEFGKKLKKVEKWWELLERGSDLLMGTQRRVEDAMDSGWDFSKVNSKGE